MYGVAHMESMGSTTAQGWASQPFIPLVGVYEHQQHAGQWDDVRNIWSKKMLTFPWALAVPAHWAWVWGAHLISLLSDSWSSSSHPWGDRNAHLSTYNIPGIVRAPGSITGVFGSMVRDLCGASRLTPNT